MNRDISLYQQTDLTVREKCKVKRSENLKVPIYTTDYGFKPLYKALLRHFIFLLYIDIKIGNKNVTVCNKYPRRPLTPGS